MVHTVMNCIRVLPSDRRERLDYRLKDSHPAGGDCDALRIAGFSSALTSFREFPNDPTQMRIPNKARGFSWRIPSNFAFPLLRPTLALVCHTKRKYLNATTRLVTLSRILSYGYEPIGRLLTLPMTPASSNACRVSYGGIRAWANLLE